MVSPKTWYKYHSFNFSLWTESISILLNWLQKSHSIIKLWKIRYSPITCNWSKSKNFKLIRFSGKTGILHYVLTLYLLAKFTFYTSKVFTMVTFSYGAWLYHNRSQYYELLAPSLYVDVCLIMMVISTLILANSVIAVYSVLRELRCLIYSVGRQKFCITFFKFSFPLHQQFFVFHCSSAVSWD